MSERLDSGLFCPTAQRWCAFRSENGTHCLSAVPSTCCSPDLQPNQPQEKPQR